MFRLPNNKHNNLANGQILIGILVAVAVFAILIHALFTLIASSFELVGFNRSRITARHLAQEKIERIRNLTYDEVGTVGGIPEGVLVQEETVRRNGLNFNINTDVVYIDDPFNGTGSPNDTDYKRARVEVSWEGITGSRVNPIILLTDIAPQTSSSSTGGTLRILVFDANSEPVSGADVRIVATSVTPPVDTTQQTNIDGEVLLPGAQPCVECYEITITKAGYSTDKTYGTDEVANPLKNHASIFEGDTTQLSFAIDLVGTIDITSTDSRENDFTPLGNVNFRLRGNKLIGTDTFAQPVYKYDQTLTTNSSGNINLTDMEWDSYTVLMPDTTSYDISGTNPLLPLGLEPAGSVDFTFSTETHTDHSFFITVKDTSQNRIASASARLYDNFGFEEIKYTGIDGGPDFGQVLFSSLDEATYHLTATASGFLDFNNDFDISGYTKTDVVMTPE